MKTSGLLLLRNLFMLMIALIPLSGCGQSGSESKAGVEKVEVQKDIHAAILSNDMASVLSYIESGADLNVKDAFSGSSPLITSATFGHEKISKALIDAGADLNVKNNDGSTALHTAAFFCRVEIVQMLIDADADKTSVNNFGATPRETVEGAFEDIKPIYEMLQQQLSPMGLQLDMEELEKKRPVIALMLQ